MFSKYQYYGSVTKEKSKLEYFYSLSKTLLPISFDEHNTYRNAGSTITGARLSCS